MQDYVFFGFTNYIMFLILLILICIYRRQIYSILSLWFTGEHFFKTEISKENRFFRDFSLKWFTNACRLRHKVFWKRIIDLKVILEFIRKTTQLNIVIYSLFLGKNQGQNTWGFCVKKKFFWSGIWSFGRLVITPFSFRKSPWYLLAACFARAAKMPENITHALKSKQNNWC